jgi:hypothetical protein
MTLEEYDNLKNNSVRFFWCDLHFATFGFETTDNVVTSAAPIFSWTIGKTLQDIKPYLLKHKAKVIELPVKILTVNV